MKHTLYLMDRTSRLCGLTMAHIAENQQELQQNHENEYLTQKVQDSFERIAFTSNVLTIAAKSNL